MRLTDRLSIPMLPDKISFVDVETTGTNAAYGRIIEIGILRVENNKLVKKYSSLINPQMYIDPFIENLTGIKQQDLENAPTFEQIKDDILELLRDSVFVAHNVRFDYAFIRNEFRRMGEKFSAKHFCTVKLARLLFPGHTHYNLDEIIARFNIKCVNRHRAFDDAQVLWRFYQKSRKHIDEQTFISAVNIALKRPSIPISISNDALEDLPESAGVYIFYGEEGVPLYIGKSINLRDRILSHFSGDHLSSTDMKISQQVKSIETMLTAGELGALFLESTLVKKMQPMFNRKLRYARKLIALKKIISEDGYSNVTTVDANEIEINELENIIGIYKSTKQLTDFLFRIAKEHGLCHRLLNIEKTKAACFAYHLGQCKGACIKQEHPLKYNLRFDEAFYKHKIKPWPFNGPIIIKERGVTKEHFIIDKWCFLGSLKRETDAFDNAIKEYAFDYDTYKILIRYLRSETNIKRVNELGERFVI